MTSRNHILATLRSSKPELEKRGIRQVGLFGSYVRGEQTQESDIDILLDFKPGMESFDNYMESYDFLEALFGEERIEVVIKNGLSPYIGPTILQEVVYA